MSIRLINPLISWGASRMQYFLLTFYIEGKWVYLCPLWTMRHCMVWMRPPNSAQSAWCTTGMFSDVDLLFRANTFDRNAHFMRSNHPSLWIHFMISCAWTCCWSLIAQPFPSFNQPVANRTLKTHKLSVHFLLTNAGWWEAFQILRTVWKYQCLPEPSRTKIFPLIGGHNVGNIAKQTP